MAGKITQTVLTEKDVGDDACAKRITSSHAKSTDSLQRPCQNAQR
jgi:hypothetical protein